MGYLQGFTFLGLLCVELRLVQLDGEHVDGVEGLHGVIQLLTTSLGINMSPYQILGKEKNMKNNNK